MLNYRALMMSDGCATAADGEHAAHRTVSDHGFGARFAKNSRKAFLS
jgi:hypothetical protein